MQRGLTITRFSNFRTATVRDPRRLEKALLDIEEVIHEPYFRTKPGPRFSLGEISSAMAYVGPDGEKAVTVPECDQADLVIAGIVRAIRFPL